MSTNILNNQQNNINVEKCTNSLRRWMEPANGVK